MQLPSIATAVCVERTSTHTASWVPCGPHGDSGMICGQNVNASLCFALYNAARRFEKVGVRDRIRHLRYGDTETHFKDCVSARERPDHG